MHLCATPIVVLQDETSTIPIGKQQQILTGRLIYKVAIGVNHLAFNNLIYLVTQIHDFWKKNPIPLNIKALNTYIYAVLFQLIMGLGCH